MAYKDPEKRREYARLWARRRKAWLTDERRAYKRQWRVVLISATCALSLLERGVPQREVYFRLLTQTRTNAAIFGCCGERRAKARLAAGAGWI